MVVPDDVDIGSQERNGHPGFLPGNCCRVDGWMRRGRIPRARRNGRPTKGPASARFERSLLHFVPQVQGRILELLDDQNLFVRLLAGIDALRLSPRDGERVLSDIAARPRGMASLEAKMSLELWRTGEFTISWWDD